jgi:hypothetical protein
MVIKLFLVYAVTLLAGSIVLLTIVKQFAGGFAGSGKKAVIYGTFSSVIASLVAYGSQFVANNLFAIFWIFAGIFLLFGIFHYAIIHKKYFVPTDENRTKTAIGEMMFAMSVVLFTVLIFSSLQYFLQDHNFLFYPMMMSGFAFFIPIFFMHTFDAAYNIPPPEYNTWVYPDQPIELPNDDPREKLLVIGFEIAKKVSDVKRTFFRAKAPENIYLGDLFYFFINDYNEVQSETPIEFFKNNEPSEWVFRLKTKWYQGIYVLDPGQTVKNNRIEENSVVICERIISY